MANFVLKLSFLLFTCCSPAEELLANAHYIPSTITKLILQWRQVASPGNGNETLQESISAEILKCLARMEEFRELQHLECNTANSTNVCTEMVIATWKCVIGFSSLFFMLFEYGRYLHNILIADMKLCTVP